MTTINSVGLGLSGSTGTGNFVGSNTPTLITPVLGVATATSLAFSSTSGIIGTTTNNNANSGSVGETITSSISSGSATVISTGTATDLTSIALTAGDWDIFGAVFFTGSGSTVITNFIAWSNTVSATLDASAQQRYCIAYSPASTAFNAVGIIGGPIPSYRISLSGNQTIYLSVSSVFTISSCAAYGNIYARRRR